MKHILIIIGSGELGGAERQAIYLAEELTVIGYRVTVLNFGRKGLTNSMLDERHISNRNIHLRLTAGKRARFLDLWKLYFTILKLRPSVIIPFTQKPNVYANALKPLLPITRVIWNQRDEGRDGGNTYLERFALKRADHIISNSESGKSFLEGHYRVKTGSVKLIKNGIRVPGKKKTFPGFNAGMIGNLHIHKDFETLLRGWSLFTKMH